MSKEAVFILRTLSSKEYNSLKKENCVFIYLNEEIKQLYPDLDNNSRLLFEEKSKKDYEETHIERVIQFGHKKSLRNNSLTKNLETKEDSYWYYLRFSLFHRTKEEFILYDAINECLESIGEVSKTIIFTNTKVDSKNFNCKTKVFLSSKSAIKKTLYFKYFTTYILLFLYRAISLKTIVKHFNRSESKTLLFANLYINQSVYSLKKDEFIKGDPHLEPLIEKSLEKEEFMYLTQLRPPSLEQNHHLSIEDYLRKRPYSNKTIVFEFYLFLALFRSDIYRNYNLIRGEINKYTTKDKYDCKYNNALLKKITFLDKMLFLAIWREKAASILFKKYSFQKTICIDEYSLQNRSINASAKQNNVTTYAIQHGAISQSNIAYRFCKEDISYKPFVDYSFIRGQHTFDMLTKANFPKSTLSIVGHMRTDAIARIKKLNHLKGSRKTIIYATQPLPNADKEIQKKQLDDFLFLCKSFPKVDFIIKPHPNENKEKYYSLKKIENLKNLEIITDQLYTLLAKSDAVITYYSTVGIEALYFGKTLITNDYYELDYQSYLKDQVSRNARNREELKRIVEKLTQEEDFQKQERINTFIANRVYRIDGEVTNRIIEKLLA